MLALLRNNPCCTCSTGNTKIQSNSQSYYLCRSRSGYTGGYNKQQSRQQQNNLTTAASYTTTSQQQQQMQQQARLQLAQNNQHLQQQTSAVQPTMLQTIQTQPTIGIRASWHEFVFHGVIFGASPLPELRSYASH